MLEEIDADEFAEWQAFDRIEPLGGLAEDYRFGLIASVLLNIHRRKGAPAVDPLELFPWQKEPPDPERDNEKVRKAVDRLIQRGNSGF